MAFDSLSAYDRYRRSRFRFSRVSNSFAGFGDTETVRPNTAFTYRLTYQNFRAAFQAQIGGYGLGNGSNGMYQGQVGADFPHVYGGTVSFDAIGSWAKDAVSLSNFGGSNTTCLTPVNCFISVNNALYRSQQRLEGDAIEQYRP